MIACKEHAIDLKAEKENVIDGNMDDIIKCKNAKRKFEDILHSECPQNTSLNKTHKNSMTQGKLYQKAIVDGVDKGSGTSTESSEDGSDMSDNDFDKESMNIGKIYIVGSGLPENDKMQLRRLIKYSNCNNSQSSTVEEELCDHRLYADADLRIATHLGKK